MKLLYLNEHLSCLNYQMNSDVGFTCQQLWRRMRYTGLIIASRRVLFL